MSTFKIRLKEVRESKRWTQADLAKKTNLTPAAISQFESGERDPNLESLKKLSTVLNVSIDFLVGKETADLPEDLIMFRNLKGLNENDKKIMIDIYNSLKAKESNNNA